MLRAFVDHVDDITARVRAVDVDKTVARTGFHKPLARIVDQLDTSKNRLISA